MTGEALNNILNKVNEGVNGLTESLSKLQTNVIDKSLEKLPLNNIFTAIDTVSSILNTDLLGLGSVSTLLGGTMFDINKYKDNKILNFILNKYGGVDGLHAKYIQAVLDGALKDHPERKECIKSMYELYAKDKQANICKETDPDSLNVVCGLGLVATDTAQKFILDKIPDVKFSYLVQTMKTAIKGKEEALDPAILTAAGCVNVPTKTLANGTVVVDITNANRDVDKFIKTFLVSRTTKLASTPGFIKDIQDKDSFALSLFGSLFVKNNGYPEAVIIGKDKPTNYVAATATTSPDTKVDSTYTKEVKTSADFVDYVKWTIMFHESGGNYGSVSKNDVGSVSLGLLQWHATRAQDLLKDLQTKDPTKFASIMGDGFKDLNLASLWNSPWNDDQATRYTNLMKEDVFKTAMNDFLDKDIKLYIKKAHEKGITDPKYVVLYCNMLNSGSGWAATVLAELDKISAADKNNPQKLYEAVNRTDFVAKYSGVKNAYDRLYTQQLASASLPQLDFSQIA
ncbi:MAG: hypothetical protein NTX91_05500 [candidate division SR1 bacterium]|nr:hypothetical protein [candidate division SR1 bacterium]